ncbi:MAG: N-acetylglucosamine-6-phosphate deacetylase [Lachnospiraceae bacterium]|nr:N-acetylglucosamine-6-phosphate deacetylase [Lachnospiraceae bacterium]
MRIRNVKVFTKNGRFLPGEVRTEGARIKDVLIQGDSQLLPEREHPGEKKSLRREYPGGEESPGRARPDGEAYRDAEECLDGEGGYLLPGMIDLHFHGCMGADFSDGTLEALRIIAEYEASIGVTAIAPAAMTLPKGQLLEILGAAAQFRRQQLGEEHSLQAELVGVHMEGPFISPVKCGAQDAAYILPRSSADFRDFQRAADGLVKLIAIAPEEAASESVRDFIGAVGDSAVVSLAHTNADYQTASKAFLAGASHVVHLYQAMSAFHHRSPGVIGAAADCPHVTAELICDGVHVHPSMIRAAFSLLGEERMILISDSMRAAGLGDGSYLLGGQEVIVSGKQARLKKDGSLAGSVTTLPDCVRYAVTRAKIPFETAVACATMHPAERLGIEKDYGTIETGKYADFVIWDKDYALRHVIRHGKRIAR